MGKRGREIFVRSSFSRSAGRSPAGKRPFFHQKEFLCFATRRDFLARRIICRFASGLFPIGPRSRPVSAEVEARQRGPAEIQRNGAGQTSGQIIKRKFRPCRLFVRRVKRVVSPGLCRVSVRGYRIGFRFVLGTLNRSGNKIGDAARRDGGTVCERLLEGRCSSEKRV